MMRTVLISPYCSTEDFAPFGSLVEPPAQAGDRQFYSQWLGGAGLSPVFHVNHVRPTALPVLLSKLECHPHAAQCFMPLDVSRFLVSVAPSLPDGSADLGAMQSFLLPGTVGVIYAPGVWHAGISVLDRPGAFAVLMWRGANDDDVFADIAPTQLISQGLTA